MMTTMSIHRKNYVETIDTDDNVDGRSLFISNARNVYKWSK